MQYDKNKLMHKARVLVRNLYGKEFWDAKRIALRGPHARACRDAVAQMYPQKEVVVSDEPSAYTPTVLEEYIYGTLQGFFDDQEPRGEHRPILHNLTLDEWRCLIGADIAVDGSFKKAERFVAEMEKLYPDIKQSIFKSVLHIDSIQ